MEVSGCALAGLARPPEHEFESGAIGIRAGHPFVQQIKMRREAFHQFIPRAAEGRPVLVRDQVVHGEIIAVRFQPTEDAPDIILAVSGLNGTEQCLFENPVKSRRRLVRVFNPASAGDSLANWMAEGAMSQPKASNPALAQARTSWPVPQPGTQTDPRFKSGCAAKKSTRPGDGSPFSQGMSRAWYRPSQ